MTSLPRRHTLARLGASAAGLLLPAAPLLAQPTATPPALDVPYVPTPQEVVERMLQMAKVGKNDVLFDLGCGDGRIVVTAAKAHGARGTGIDIDPERISEARKNAEQAGVTKQVNFKVADLFETDVSPASVVTLYLLPNINTRLRPQLWKQLKVGARVVSHAFDMGPEWPPEKTESVEGRTIYYWTIKEAHKRAAAKA
ncbi:MULTISPECIES: class I SAM-dependent methyltransferase [unclassified Massilia]|uniref:class I SAM-dependent methyltransferase n=1 Tax=unclassified Massilia TaxID=2609279 RepID=UPI00177B4613|nr:MULTISPECIES: class I SAM-dependent methyltransferase [unclassified Massilia]MBD8528440.1 class I SAM-dependent methyltransferase [Massilia sp. CFBP 13647]MBD8671938.1 class I SAM-dependent methyltransferase [Massilia sp. CFBP 13721]